MLERSSQLSMISLNFTNYCDRKEDCEMGKYMIDSIPKIQELIVQSFDYKQVDLR